MEAFIVIVLFVLALVWLIYRCATGRPAMPEAVPQVEEPVEKVPEPPPFPKIYLPPRRSDRQAYRRAGAALTGAALLGAWDSSGSDFMGGEIETDDSPFHEDHEFHDCSLSTGNIDIVHGGYDPTGNYGMAGDFNPHFDDPFDHSDPFESDFGTCEIGGGIDSFGSDFGGIEIGSDTFGSDTIGSFGLD